MKTKLLGLTLALSLMAAGACFANPNMGTWKLNEEKSQLDPAQGKNSLVKYEAAGDEIKVMVEGVDKNGKSTNNTWTGKFDGNDYPVKGDPRVDSRSYKQVDDRTLEMTIKKDGKVVMTGTIKVSADGKKRVVTTESTNAEGKKVESKGVFNKEP